MNTRVGGDGLTVICSDYRAHQSHHVVRDGRAYCAPCSPFLDAGSVGAPSAPDRERAGMALIPSTPGSGRRTGARSSGSAGRAPDGQKPRLLVAYSPVYAGWWVIWRVRGRCSASAASSGVSVRPGVGATSAPRFLAFIGRTYKALRRAAQPPPRPFDPPLPLLRRSADA